MSSVLPDHAKPVTFDEHLDGMRNVPGPIVGPHHLYSHVQRLFGYLQQADILFSMKSGESIREGYERAVNYYSILSDFRRAVLEEEA